jgi:hypothetical protein
MCPPQILQHAELADRIYGEEELELHAGSQGGQVDFKVAGTA